jgi:hypothetical protein
MGKTKAQLQKENEQIKKENEELRALMQLQMQLQFPKKRKLGTPPDLAPPPATEQEPAPASANLNGDGTGSIGESLPKERKLGTPPDLAPPPATEGFTRRVLGSCLHGNATRRACKQCRSEDRRSEVKCEHGRRERECKQCGGSSICEHGRQKSVCKECGGSAICAHGRHKYACKECILAASALGAKAVKNANVARVNQNPVRTPAT